MAAPTVDIDELIDRQTAWGPAGWILLWAAAAMLADGYDLLATSYVAPNIIREWGLTKAAFGPAFSVANAASMLGGAAAGFYADSRGRKKAIVAGTLLLGFSTLGTVLATNLHEFLAWRLAAGFGLGAVPPIAIVMVNEFAPNRMRATIVAALYLGTSLGALLAGFVGFALVPEHGWRVMFLIGGFLPLAVSVGLWLYLPESLRYLVTRRPGSPETSRVAARLAPDIAFAPDTLFVMRSEPATPGFAIAQLFAHGRWPMTLLFWLAYFASGIALYTVISWSPVILESLGLTAARAAFTASLGSLAGWFGGIIITRFMDRFGLRAMVVPPLLGFPLVAGLGYLTGSPVPVIMGVSLLVGMTVSGGHSGLHATGGIIYPTAIRANGVALGLLVTRSAGVVAPIAAGLLFSSNGASRQVLWFAAVPLLVVSACFSALRRTT